MIGAVANRSGDLGSVEQYKGSWALVTGASSGIGEEFCRQLARVGVNLVIVARRADRLDRLAALLRQEQGVDVRVFVTDLSQDGSPKAIRDFLANSGVVVRVLVNNAAGGRWGRFIDAPSNFYLEMIKVNASAVVLLCRELERDLASHGSAVIINVSSPAALQPVPYMALYAATKAFVHNFSLALHYELKDSGIYVQTLVPGPTRTEFDEKAKAYASKLSERGEVALVVGRSLRGISTREPVVTTAKGLFTQRLFAGLAPYRVVLREVAKLFRPPE